MNGVALPFMAFSCASTYLCAPALSLLTAPPNQS